MSDFSYTKFIENAGPELVYEYFQKELKLDPSFLQDSRAHVILEAIRDLSVEQQRKVEEDFQLINHMADEKGTFDLNLEAQEKGVTVPEGDSDEARALWFFIRHYGLFEAAMVWDRINYLKNWEEEYMEQNPGEVDWGKRAQAFAEKVKQHYWDIEGRKINCAAEQFRHEDRISIVLYPEGYPKGALKYENGEIKRHSARPIQEVYFIVNLTEKKISMKSTTRYSRDKIQLLKQFFFDHVLEQPFNTEVTVRYKLDHLLERAFGISLLEKLPAGEGIDFVKIKEVALKDKDQKGQVTILKADEREGDPTEIYDMIRARNISRSHVFVSYVRIQVKFPGKGHIGSRTFLVGYPNRCSLGRTEKERRCKEYLKYWNVIPESDESSS